MATRHQLQYSSAHEIIGKRFYVVFPNASIQIFDGAFGTLLDAGETFVALLRIIDAKLFIFEAEQALRADIDAL